MEEKYKKIEKAVCGFYKVSENDVYTKKNSVYPYGIARRMLMYLLYVNGMKVYHIAKLFGVSVRITNKYVAEIHVEYKKDTKIREDIESINKIINNI